MLVAATITAFVLASICGICFSTAKEWERQQGQAQALVATSRACSKLSDYVSQCIGWKIASRFQTNDALAVLLPQDSAYGGTYVPVWTGGHVAYRGGACVVFYLSDSTGSFSRSGDILWAATSDWSLFPAAAFVPDRDWSLYYNGPKGKVAPIRSLSFAVDTSGERTVIVITAVSAYKVGTGEQQIRQSRTVCPRNT
jgi:hypothetical protein